jgi:hypothetical protein
MVQSRFLGAQKGKGNFFAAPSFNYEIAPAVGTTACLVGLIGGGKEYKIKNSLEKHCHGLQGDAQFAADQLSDEGQSAGT